MKSTPQPPRPPAEKRQLPMWTQSGRGPASARDFVARLVQLDESCPLTPAEVDETLTEAGIDPKQALADALALVEEVTDGSISQTPKV